ncbi:NhaP-type Na+/H+ or K+/H+ antiporter [Flavobacteriaceae bacterium MAR_2010_72]|nr:NhaP-type Na+/H+ or K+/H+ antiporter [Flavobacteriaceae bacterium MAR_2010_72]
MEQFDAYTLIIAASVIVLISFFFVAFSKRTNVPSVLLLIGLGVGLQYLLQYFGIATPNFFSVLEVLGILGLIMIVLEAALDLKLRRDKIGTIISSFFIATVGLFASFLVAGIILFYMVPGMSWAQALLYATPLSILSSAIIIPSVSNLKDEKREFHIYESTFSDIIGIMLFYFLIGYFENEAAASAGLSTGNPTGTFIINLFVTLVIALISSYVILIVFQKINSGAKLFVLISVLFLLYSIAKKFHLSPLIIILIFGLAVSNSSLLFRGPFKRMLNPEKFKQMEHGLHNLTAETAFIVRTFFFVIFGASIMISSLFSFEVLKVSLALIASIFIIRFLLLRIFIGKDISPQVWIAPRGLITVLLFYAIPISFQTDRFDSGILLFIIIATGLFMTVGLILNSISKAYDRNLDVLPETPEKLLVESSDVSPNFVNRMIIRLTVFYKYKILYPITHHPYYLELKKGIKRFFLKATKALDVKPIIGRDSRRFGSRLRSVIRIIRNPEGVKLKENKDYIDLKNYVRNVIFETNNLEGILFDVIIFTLIILSVAMVIIQSVGVSPFWNGVLFTFELIITVIFSVEYILRIWTSIKPKKYVFSTFGIIDLLAILPLFLELIFVNTFSLGVIRLLRLLRIFRVLKLVRFLLEADVLAKGIKANANKIFVFLFFVMIVCTIMGSVMFVIEGPEHGYNSIPRGIYWAVVTLTTVGYGDISPGTPIGQFIAMMIMILGYGVIAVPTGLVAAGVAKAAKEKKKDGVYCPKCKSEDILNDSNYCRICGTDLTTINNETP